MAWTHLRDTTPKARKSHVCDLCGKPIFAGEAHIYRRGIRDGEFVASRMHSQCEAVTRGWSDDDWEGGVDFGEFRRALAALGEE